MSAERILDIDGHAYNGVWRLWKLASVVLFAVMVWIARDISKSIKTIAGERE